MVQSKALWKAVVLLLDLPLTAVALPLKAELPTPTLNRQSAGVHPAGVLLPHQVVHPTRTPNKSDARQPGTPRHEPRTHMLPQMAGRPLPGMQVRGHRIRMLRPMTEGEHRLGMLVRGRRIRIRVVVERRVRQDGEALRVNPPGVLLVGRHQISMGRMEGGRRDRLRRQQALGVHRMPTILG